jgi:hypothetical protein
MPCRGDDYVPADIEVQVSRDPVEERHGSADAGLCSAFRTMLGPGKGGRCCLLCLQCNNMARGGVEACTCGVGWWVEFSPRDFPEAVVAITGRPHGCMSCLGNGRVQNVRDALLGFEPVQVPSTAAWMQRGGVLCVWSATALHTRPICQPGGRLPASSTKAGDQSVWPRPSGS